MSSRLKDFRLPDLGEGLTEGEILQWMVKVGDTVTLNQPIVEVETAKAAVEVPSPYAGLVTKIHHEAGATVDVGAPIITFDTDPSAGPLEQAAGNAAAGAFANPVESAAPKGVSVVGDPTQGELVPSRREPGQEGGALIGEVGANGRTATLVGYGPRSVTATRRARTDSPAAPVTAAPAALLPAPVAPARVSAAQVGQAAAARSGALPVLAKPPVRKLAKDLGVDLSTLTGSGPSGSISREDVRSAGASSPVEEVAQQPSRNPVAAGERETREPIKGVRKMMAVAMSQSAFTSPHVTEWITVDVSATMQLVERLKARRELKDVRISPLLVLARAVILAMKRTPEINSFWDDAAQEVVHKHYVNLGIAAATPRGLVVPNVKDADSLSLTELATALAELTAVAREGRTQPAEMSGGTFTITNVGVFGVDAGTPIINPGESAILCFGAINKRPWVDEAGEIVVRDVTTLALSFDHRHIDGEKGSRFLADVAGILQDPGTALLF